MRRVVNPPLLLAAVVVAGGWLWALVALWESSTDIKTAKEDAFDSIAVLEAARAIAYDANGDESRWLLVKINGGQADTIQSCAKFFHQNAAKIASFSKNQTAADWLAEIARTQKKDAPSKGCLAVELTNITFPGELQAAQETLRQFWEYLKIDRQIRDLKDEHQAVELCLGTNPGQSDWAFDQFETALSKTIDINKHYFKPSLEDAAGRVAGLAWLMPLGLALAVSLLTYLGLRPRLNEYAVY
jgi:hypothetical protein